jgi:hypothetical protein
MWKRFKNWISVDHIVDLTVDLFLLLIDVLSSPILIVMRLLRWIVGNYLLDGVKNKIKRVAHWSEGKHPLLQIWVWTLIICAGVVILTLMWLFGTAFGEWIMEEWGSD